MLMLVGILRLGLVAARPVDHLALVMNALAANFRCKKGTTAKAMSSRLAPTRR